MKMFFRRIFKGRNLDKRPYKVNKEETAATNERLSGYYWQLEQLLDRIEHSSTHYQVLDTNRSATSEQLSQAYRRALALLNPAYQPLGFSATVTIQERVKQAITKISLAGAILLNFGKRIEYDNSLLRRPTASLPVNRTDLPWQKCSTAETVINSEKPQEKAEEKPSALTRDPNTVLREDHSKLKPIATQQPIGSVLAGEKAETNRRRGERLKLSIPVYVTGHDRNTGKWREMAKTLNVSRFGIALQMRTRIPQGTVVHLTLPLPVKLRNHSYGDHNYNVYAIVRRVQPPKDGLRIVGVELLGERPPAGFLEQPWAIFRTTNWLGADRRREPRHLRAESVGLEYLDTQMQPIQSELAITESISRSGMRVKVKTAPEVFDYVKVTSLAQSCSGIAALCNRFVGEDGGERLCLNFLDKKWPI
jgi:hypothetical protein